MAYTDNTAYAWFPPAGIGRGNVDCVKAKKSLVLSEEDILSKGRINFVKTFALDGVKIWGQRTLQIADTALNRIGVRRMMLYLRKQVRRSNLPLIFEPNDNTTKNKFNEIVNPILNSIKTNRGISEYDIKFDESEESRARHEMNVRIWVKPIGALEFISIDFMITDEGFDFSTI
jgi:phage tail sheath protein FI